MEFHRRRLINHVHLRVANLDASRRFYKIALTAIGISDFVKGDHFFAADELWIDEAEGPVPCLHLPYQVPKALHQDR